MGRGNKRWLDYEMPFDRALAGWAEQRSAFAVGIKFWEWVAVDSFYAELAVTIPCEKIGQPASEMDVKRADRSLRLGMHGIPLAPEWAWTFGD